MGVLKLNIGSRPAAKNPTDNVGQDFTNRGRKGNVITGKRDSRED